MKFLAWVGVCLVLAYGVVPAEADDLFVAPAPVSSIPRHTITKIDTLTDRSSTVALGSSVDGIGTTIDRLGKLYFTFKQDDSHAFVRDFSLSDLSEQHAINVSSRIGDLVVNGLGDRLLVPQRSTLTIIDTATDKIIADLPELDHTHLAAAHDSPLVYATSDNSVTVIDSESGTPVSSFETVSSFGSIAISGDNRTLYGAVEGEDKVLIIDVASKKSVGSIDVTSPWGLTVIPQTVKLYVANGTPAGETRFEMGRFGNTPKNVVSIIDLRTHRVVRTLPVEGPLSFAAITPDGRKLYYYNTATGVVTVIGTATDKVLATIRAGMPP